MVVFNGARDSYQVPIALAEVGLLETLVTDVGTEMGGRIAEWVGRRVGPFSATSTPMAIGRQYLPRLLNRSIDYDAVDRALSRKAARIARRRDAHVWAYSGYGAALDRRASERARILFVFHPRPACNREILEADAERWPEARAMHDNDRSASYAERKDQLLLEELRWSSHVVVASEFTKRSLPEPWRTAAIVVPYGCPAPSEAVHRFASSARPQLLFIGQGIQRKGLHHLARVWSEFHAEADLTIVAGRLDPAVAASLPAGIRVLPHQGQAELQRLMAEADALVLPSLVEGFGLVLGEALACGCALIGSSNTGLADLRLPSDIGYLHEAGDLESLALAIAAFLADFEDEPRVARKARARALATQRSWNSFRGGIANVAVAASRSVNGSEPK